MERKSISFCPIFLPIFIPKELFYRVQEEIMRRSSMCKAAVTRKKKRLAENYEQGKRHGCIHKGKHLPDTGI